MGTSLRFGHLREGAALIADDSSSVIVLTSASEVVPEMYDLANGVWGGKVNWGIVEVCPNAAMIHPATRGRHPNG